MKLSYTLTTVVTAALLSAGCASEPVDPCKVHPTKTNDAGVWVEHDGEQFDDDPCDSDDLNDKLKRPKKKTTKPVKR